MSHRSAITMVGVLAFALGCDQGPAALAACPASVTVTADTGTSPRFAWTPPCRASNIIVDPNSDIVDDWALGTLGDTDGLAPPIRYGASPNGTTTIYGPTALQPGTSHRVRILRATGDTAMPFEVIGAALFTP